jgi:hypothetical protein
MPVVESVERPEPASPPSPEPPPVADTPLAADDEPGAVAPPRRAIADTAPIPQHPDAPAETASARQPAPAALRPLDIVLIIVTFGIYGIVLWAQRRRPPEA